MLLAASTIFWVVSSKEFALCSVTSIVRFSAIIARKAGPIFWWCSWFVLLGLEMAREFWGLDTAEAVPFQRESTTICVGRSAGALGVGIGCALLDGKDLQDGTGNSCGRLDGAHFRFGRKAKITGSLVFGASGVARELGIAFRKDLWAQRVIGRLERGGIVARVGDARRGRVFCAGGVAGDFGGGDWVGRCWGGVSRGVIAGDAFTQV